VTGPDFVAERTVLSERRTMLGFIANAALLLRMGDVIGVSSGVAVIVMALFVWVAPRRYLSAGVWAAIATAVGVLDLLAIVTYRR